MTAEASRVILETIEELYGELRPLDGEYRQIVIGYNSGLSFTAWRRAMRFPEPFDHRDWDIWTDPSRTWPGQPDRRRQLGIPI